MTRNHRILFGVILFTAAFLRLAGLRFGEPLVVHPEERRLLDRAIHAAAHRGHPGSFEEPSGMVYLTLLVESFHFLVGGDQSAREFWGHYVDNPFPFHVWIRFLTCVSGVVGAYAVWLLGREWDRGRIGMRFLSWGGAALLAVHFLHVRDSHFAAADVPATTAVTFALWLLLREFHREATNVRRLGLIGLFIGLCCGLTYSAAALVFALLYVGFTNALKDEEITMSPSWLVGSAGVLVLLVLAGFFLTNPHALLDPGRFWSDIGARWIGARIHTPVFGGGETFLLGYIEGPWVWGGGMGLAGFAFFGLMMAVLRHEPEDKVMLAFAFPFLVLISLEPGVWGRHFLPLVPLQILWAVRFIAVYAMHPWALELVGPATRKAVAVGIVVLVGLESALPALRLAALLRQTDTRAEAAQLIPESIESGDKVLLTAFCPPLPPETQKRIEESLLSQRTVLNRREVYSPAMPSLEEIREEGVTVVLYSSFYWEGASQDFVRKAFPEIRTYEVFLSDLDAEGEVELEVRAVPPKFPFHPENIYAPTFNLWDWSRPGPNLTLYRIQEP